MRFFNVIMIKYNIILNLNYFNTNIFFVFIFQIWFYGYFPLMLQVNYENQELSTLPCLHPKVTLLNALILNSSMTIVS
jgi:hypothetical protein